MTQTWQQLQDTAMTEIRVAMVRQKLGAKDICDIVGVSQSHWSRLSNCKSPILMDDLMKITEALGLRITVTIEPKN